MNNPEFRKEYDNNYAEIVFIHIKNQKYSLMFLAWSSVINNSFIKAVDFAVAHPGFLRWEKMSDHATI